MRSFAAFRDVRLHAVVEFLGRIVSHLFLTVIDRRRLYDDCQVTSWTDRNVVADHFISKEFRVLVFKTEAVIFLILIPLFELDDQVDRQGLLDALESVTSFDQLQSRLTLTDPALTCDQDAFAEYIDKNSVDTDARSKLCL